MESITEVSVSDGDGVANPWLEVRHDISASVRRQHRDELLLIAAAGTSVLVTSLLLRLVIWRGLLQPLVALRRELDVLRASWPRR